MNKHSQEYNNYFPNIYNSRNTVWSSNKVWVIYIFDCTFIYHQRKTVVGLCFVLDIAYNEILVLQKKKTRELSKVFLYANKRPIK